MGAGGRKGGEQGRRGAGEQGARGVEFLKKPGCFLIFRDVSFDNGNLGALVFYGLDGLQCLMGWIAPPCQYEMTHTFFCHPLRDTQAKRTESTGDQTGSGKVCKRQRRVGSYGLLLHFPESGDVANALAPGDTFFGV